MILVVVVDVADVVVPFWCHHDGLVVAKDTKKGFVALSSKNNFSSSNHGLVHLRLVMLSKVDCPNHSDQ